MCGIAGFCRRDGQAREDALTAVRSMCDRIRHRGPDDEGYHVDGGLAMGMRRLSIIDLAGGQQPIANEDQTVWVVFNGEIYNYRELRHELCSQGHRFKTSSDTEVLVHLYEEHGAGGLERLRGMFAFSIWDGRKRELLLARDRFGKKPLYYAALPSGLVFGSELKSLRAAGIPEEIDEDALRLYFQFGYIPDPFTPFRAVRKLLPGSWLRYSAVSGETESDRYWRMPDFGTAAPAMDEDQACLQLREAFDEAVRIRMVADVPLGAFLSGGIDSSLVVASMALQSSQPVKTFSIGFEEPEFNELPYAALVANKYRTNHREIVVKPDTVALVSKLAWHLDEPFADASTIPTYLVSEAAVSEVKVALSGDGGDELFAGYSVLPGLQKLEKFDRVPRALRRLLGCASELLPYSARGKNWLWMATRPSPLERYFEFNYAPYNLRRRLLQPKWMLPADHSFIAGALGGYALSPSARDTLAQAMYFEATANLAGDMLVKVDRASMAASLEVRCPLLDHKLAELAIPMPHSWKLRNGGGKYILKRALGDRLPPELLARPKTGFGFPLSIWFRTSLRAFLHDHLMSKVFLGRGIVRPAFARDLIAEHQAERRDNSGWLWSLLMLELWFRAFQDPRQAPR